MRYLSLVFLALIVSVAASKAQSPGLRPFKQDPNFFKVELKKKASGNFLNEHAPADKKIYDIKNGLLSFTSVKGKVYRMNTDGMPCLVVDPRTVDPKSMVVVRNLPYIPNPYK